MVFLGVFTALYDYTAQNEQELSFHEGDLLFVVEKSEEDEWWKAKRKGSAAEEDEPVGLIPCNYVQEAKPQRRARALYDYTRQTDEEISLVEDAALAVYDASDTDWTLVGLNGEYGFAPANYIELLEVSVKDGPTTSTTPANPEESKANLNARSLPTASDAPSQSPAAALAGIIQRTASTPPPAYPASPPQEHGPHHKPILTPDASDEEIEPSLPPSLPARPVQRPATPLPPVASPASSASPRSPMSPRHLGAGPRHNASEPLRSPGAFHLYNISEMVSVMGKRKKMPTTLGINTATGIIMIAPEKSRDGPQQEWTGDKLIHYSIEGKHIFMELVRPSKSVDFHAGAKDTAEEIVFALGEIAGAAKAEGLREVLAASSGLPASKKGQVLYDFTAQGDDEVTVDVGDAIVILDDTKSEEWWLVRRLKNGKEGVMPSSYIEVVKGAPTTAQAIVNSHQSTTAQNRMEEERLTKQALRSSQIAHANQLQVAELESGVRLPQRGSSLMNKDLANARAADTRSPSTAQSPRAPSTTKSKPDRSKIRVWTDRSGSFKVEAEFIGCTEGKIHLHKLNGVKIAVPVVKMSREDLEFVEKCTGMSLDEDKPLSEIRRQSLGMISSALPKRTSLDAPPPPAKNSASASASRKDEYDWFDFFLKCGVVPQLCERYAASFSKDSMEESILPDVGPDVLRTLGLKEGDILKVMKHLDNLYGRGAAGRAKRNVSFGGAEVMGNEGEKGEPKTISIPGGVGGLFSGPGGALRNNTRKGRPAPPIQTSDVVDPKVFERSSGPKTPGRHVELSPQSRPPPPIKKDDIGFEDDAWDVKPSKEQRSASQSAGAHPPAAAPPPPAVLSDTMRELSLLSPPLQPTIEHKPPSAPPAADQQPARAEPMSFMAPSQGQYQSARPGLGPNQPSHAPREGLQSPTQGGFMTQPTGAGPPLFQNPTLLRQRPQPPPQAAPAQGGFVLAPPPRPLSAPQGMVQPAGFAAAPLQPQLTGIPNPSMMPTGPVPPLPSFNNFQQPAFLHYQPSPFPSQPGGFAPQATGLLPQMTGGPGLGPSLNSGYGPFARPPQLFMNGQPQQAQQQQQPPPHQPPHQQHQQQLQQHQQAPPPLPSIGIGAPLNHAPPSGIFQQQHLLGPHLTGAPNPTMGIMPAQALRTGSINSYLQPALQPQLAGANSAPFSPPAFHSFPPPPIPPQPLPQPPTMNMAPLQPQRTGPAPPVRFGVVAAAPKLVPQPTGLRANLSQASKSFAFVPSALDEM
ncbi:MAG: cytoskeletal protein binding protein [Phylliscum demangeonii]|nr:MAG: cytoskeletal protein binding protein [Phylliscum demangeonii]